MRLCRGWMTCPRARKNQEWGDACAHASLHTGSNICFRKCYNGDKTICMEVGDATLSRMDDLHKGSE